MDGHSSHYTLELLDFARANNIIILGYPPHCTHALQGLDVVCFAVMKGTWREEINIFEEVNKCQIGKGDFAMVFGKAFLRAFKPETVLAAFAKTGIHPFNPEVISVQQTKTSIPTSNVGSLPLTLPSPVCAIMDVFHHRTTTSFDTSPSTLRIAPLPPAFPTVTPATPRTPPLYRQVLERTIDPSLFTPSKRMRLFTSALANTASGSFLVDQPRIQSSQTVAAPTFIQLPTIPDPDWSLLNCTDLSDQSRPQLEEHITKLTESLALAQAQISSKNIAIECANAQLAVGSVWNTRLNEALNTKENKAQPDRTRLFPRGEPRVLTNDDFYGEVEEAKQKRVDKETAKVQRAVAREGKKSQKAAIETEWKTQLETVIQLQVEWDAEKVRLRAGKMLVRDIVIKLGKRPVRPLKPKAVVEEDSGPESGGDDAEWFEEGT